MLSVSHLSRCCKVVGVTERNRTSAGVWVSEGVAALAFQQPEGFYPVSCLKKSEKEKRRDQRWSLDKKFCSCPKLLFTSYKLALLS